MLRKLDLLHYYVNVVIIFISIIELHKVLMPCKSSQYLHFSSHILDGNCSSHLPDINIYFNAFLSQTNRQQYSSRMVNWWFSCLGWWTWRKMTPIILFFVNKWSLAIGRRLQGPYCGLDQVMIEWHNHYYIFNLLLLFKII